MSFVQLFDLALSRERMHKLPLLYLKESKPITKESPLYILFSDLLAIIVDNNTPNKKAEEFIKKVQEFVKKNIKTQDVLFDIQSYNVKDDLVAFFDLFTPLCIENAHDKVSVFNGKRCKKRGGTHNSGKSQPPSNHGNHTQSDSLSLNESPLNGYTVLLILCMLLLILFIIHCIERYRRGERTCPIALTRNQVVPLHGNRQIRHNIRNDRVVPFDGDIVAGPISPPLNGRIVPLHGDIVAGPLSPLNGRVVPLDGDIVAGPLSPLNGRVVHEVVPEVVHEDSTRTSEIILYDTRDVAESSLGSLVRDAGGQPYTNILGELTILQNRLMSTLDNFISSNPNVTGNNGTEDVPHNTGDP